MAVVAVGVAVVVVGLGSHTRPLSRNVAVVVVGVPVVVVGLGSQT